MEVELDPENRSVIEKDEQEEEEGVKSDVDVNSKDTGETANTSLAASRTRRSTAGLKLSKIGEKNTKGKFFSPSRLGVHIWINTFMEVFILICLLSSSDNFEPISAVQKERDSDESTDEESDEAEGVNADFGLFPHRCPKCNKRFKLLSNLAKHRKVANENTAFNIMYRNQWELDTIAKAQCLLCILYCIMNLLCGT